MSSIVGDTNAESLARLEEFICTSRSTLDQPTLAEGDQREQTLQTFGDALMAKYQTIHDLDALEEAINVYEETLTLWEKSHPRRAILLHTISDALFNLWLAHPTDAGSLDRCIALRREALELRSRGHAERHKTLTALSDAISSRYALRGDAEVLQEAVSLLREALTLCPPGHASRYIVCNNLANALQNTFIQCGELSYLLEAATLLREALRELPPDSPSRDYCLNNLATALQMTFEIQGNPATLTESIDLHREALSLRPQGNPSRVHSLGNLSRTLLILHSQEGNSSILKESIELQREALQLRPPGHPDRPISLDILATGLQRTFDQTGNLDALLECIALNREVVSLRPPGHHHRAVCLNNLGNALQTMYEQAEDATILDEAIHIQREALRLSVSVQLYRTRMLSNLAAVLYMRHIHQGDLDALAEAVALQREALQLSPPGHPDRYGALNNLATSLETVYFQDQDSGVLSELTDLGREALRICPPGHPFHATCLYNLSGALHSVFLQTKDTSTLNEAIQLGKDSLTHSLPGYPQRLNFLNRLAISLRLEYNSSTAETSSRLDECISLHEEALALAPSGHSFRSRQLHELARSLQGRYRRLVTLETGQRILKLLREAIACCGPIHPDRLLYLRDASIHLLNPGPVFDFSEGVTLISEALSDDLLIARSRLRAAVVVLPIVDQAFVRARNEASEPTFQDEAAPRVLSLYLRAMGLLPQVANFSLSTAARLQVLAGSEELCRAGAMRAMWLRRWETAVEMLEEGRGIFWSQALRLRSGLDGVPLTDRQELERMFHLLDSSSQQVEEFSSIAHKERDMERRRHLNLQVEELINKIRTYPGRDRFLLPPTFSVLMEAIPHGFVIMIIASSVVPGYSVLVLDASSKSIHPVFVPPSPERFRIDVIKRNMPRDIGADMSLDVDDSEPSDINPDPRGIRRARKVPVTFEDGLADLWVYLVKPILDAMGWKKSAGRHRHRVWWCLTGELSFLPIHAAGIFNEVNIQRHGGAKECAADYVVSSYVPTIAALIKARAEWKTITRQDISALVVHESTPGQGYTAIKAVDEEARMIRERLEAAQAGLAIDTSTAPTVLGVLQTLQTAKVNVLHLACHGIQDVNPLKSAFILKDGRLSIQELMKLDLHHAAFAFLSACQTAKGDERQPDQAVHLAASLLFCGFRSVIGTLWSMEDVDGPIVASWVYDAILRAQGLDLDDIPYALDEAVCRLREEGVPASRWAAFVHMGG